MDIQSDLVVAYLTAVETAGFATIDPFGPDVELDATVPNWRFSTTGAVAVRHELGRWFADPGCFRHLCRTALPTGELVEFTLEWMEGGVAHTCHQVHVFEVRDGAIVADRAWCGGRWPAGLVAEMQAAGRG